MPEELDRFVLAQQAVYDSVIEELRRGHKSGHWIWFVFPQVGGLGYSAMSQAYGISSLDEARAYLAHPILGARLRECAGLVLASGARTAREILDDDSIKLGSCMTLFHRAAPDEPVFVEVLDRYFGGVADPLTDAILAGRGAAFDER
jgi:uncharacterized protein (DUF1810 family)